MKLERKKELVARTLDVGKDRIVFNNEMLSDIKEAITKQDIHDLKNAGAIFVKEVSGRRKKQVRKTRRRSGSIKKKVKKGKKEYMTLTRKLRKHIATLKTHGKIEREDAVKVRKQIRAKAFRSLSHMRESLKQEGKK